MRKIIIAVTGASGSLYAKLLIDALSKIDKDLIEVKLIFSKTAKDVWLHELKSEYTKNIKFEIFDYDNLWAASASGSAQFDTMIVCPCSMGTLARIANGISDDLITRSADVILKEKQKLILVTRETPLNLIHINNMKTITLSGGIICPASPSFYSIPTTIEAACNTVVERILSLANIPGDFYKWGE